VPVGAMLGATAAGSGPNSAWLMAAATASPLSPQQISLSYRHPTAARTRLPRQPLSSSRPTAFDGGPVAANWDGRPRGDGDGLVRQHPFGL